MEWLVAAAALLLAFVNGANDNMKGVATLYGSGVLGYRRALLLATVSTGLGSLASVALAGSLARAFSARGLVPDAALTPDFLAAVAFAAAAAVLLATRLGLPVSTTHALVGALAGAGLVAAGSALDLSRLGGAFALPLLAGPLLGLALGAALVRTGRSLSPRFAGAPDPCVCVERSELAAPAAAGAASLASPELSLVIADAGACDARGGARVLGLRLRPAIDAGHLLSGGLVGFARGVNDTPKIFGLVAGLGLVTPGTGALVLGAAMALGGALAARRVAETLARRLTPMTPGQGLAANAATSFLVVGASQLGLPVSTTHVSAGGIFGIGATSGALHWTLAGEVALAWVATLPLAAALGAIAMALLG